MANFPVHPVNGSLFTADDGIIYVYNFAENYWKRNSATVMVPYASSQVTRFGIAGASPGSPRIVSIAIPATLDFNRPKVEVLKFTPGTNNVVVTESDFNNADAGSFNADPYGQVIFDGTMHLKTSYSAPMTNNGVLGTGNLWSQVIDKTLYKTIERIQLY